GTDFGTGETGRLTEDLPYLRGLAGDQTRKDRMEVRAGEVVPAHARPFAPLHVVAVLRVIQAQRHVTRKGHGARASQGVEHYRFKRSIHPSFGGCAQTSPPRNRAGSRKAASGTSKGIAGCQSRARAA